MILRDAHIAHITDRPDYEQSVRHRMAQEGIPEEKYPYLIPKPHPEPEYLRLWLKDQFGHAPDSYKLWNGWILMQSQADSLMVFLTWANCD